MNYDVEDSYYSGDSGYSGLFVVEIVVVVIGGVWRGWP